MSSPSLRTWFVIGFKYGRYSDKWYYSDRGFVHDLEEATQYPTADAAQPTIELLKAAFPNAELYRETKKWSGRACYVVAVKETIKIEEAENNE